MRGRRWIIKREDLEAFVRKLVIHERQGPAVEVDFEALRSEMNERLVGLLRHYVEGTPRPADADEIDVNALLYWGLTERGGGVSHSGPPRASDQGRAWLEWYDGRT